MLVGCYSNYDTPKFSEGGEVGILGGTFGQGTVVKGEDKPPAINLPGLNFNSDEGRKLIG